MPTWALWIQPLGQNRLSPSVGFPPLFAVMMMAMTMTMAMMLLYLPALQ
jgi:hypothetical protein